MCKNIPVPAVLPYALPFRGSQVVKHNPCPPTAYQYQNGCKAGDYEEETEIFTHWLLKQHKNPLSKKCYSTLILRSG